VKKDSAYGASFSEVGVRLPSTTSFLPVGFVGADTGTPIEGAVAIQKRLIAEHALRIHPSKVTATNSKSLEWGVRTNEEEVRVEGTSHLHSRAPNLPSRPSSSICSP